MFRRLFSKLFNSRKNGESVQEVINEIEKKTDSILDGLTSLKRDINNDPENEKKDPRNSTFSTLKDEIIKLKTLRDGLNIHLEKLLPEVLEEKVEENDNGHEEKTNLINLIGALDKKYKQILENGKALDKLMKNKVK